MEPAHINKFTIKIWKKKMKHYRLKITHRKPETDIKIDKKQKSWKLLKVKRLIKEGWGMWELAPVKF